MCSTQAHFLVWQGLTKPQKEAGGRVLADNGEHSGLWVSSLPLDSAILIRVRFPGVARGIATPWPLGTA